MLTILIAILLAGCADDPRVRVDLVYEQPDVPADVQEFTWAGADAWNEFAIVAGTPGDPAMPECPEMWWASSSCEMTIRISYRPTSELGGYAGLTDRNARRSMISSDLRGFPLMSVVAHEVGHSLFGAAHLPPGEVGIMSAVSSGTTTPTDADRRYVLRQTGGAVGS